MKSNKILVMKNNLIYLILSILLQLKNFSSNIIKRKRKNYKYFKTNVLIFVGLGKFDCLTISNASLVVNPY